jgi:chitodextrinase
MTHLKSSKFAVRLGAILLLLLLFLSFSSAISPALAAPPRDKKPPTRPNNLHVTNTTAYSASLAWNPSTDNSGVFSYKVVVSYGQTWTVDQTQTSFTWNFLVPNNTYSFYVYAVDGSGNQSQNSNTVTTTTLPDVTPPTPPVLSLIDVNPTEVALEWTASTDDGAWLTYQVYVNDILNVDAGTARSAVVHNLTPETTYNITVRARDSYGNNLSEPSNAVTVTTAAVNPNDTEAPPPPSNFYALDISDCAEVWLFWTQSFDNQTPQASIQYVIYVNGVYDQTIVGDDQAITYALLDDNTITIFAQDSAGNSSEPVTATVSLC